MSLQRNYDLIVPQSLHGASRVLQLDQHVVVIAADNGAVAAKLRQMTTDLISLFQARGCEVTGIQIQVQVARSRPPVRTQRKLSQDARVLLEQLGQKLGDSPLKTALRRLARRR